MSALAVLEAPGFGLGFIAITLILFMMWQGWRLGVVRQAVGLAALIVGTGAGIFAASFGATILRPFVPLPDAVLHFLGGLAIGLVVYAVISLVGAILFKKTRDQGFAPVRLIFGVGGAALGGVYGVVLVAAFALALRLFGMVAETMLAASEDPHLAGRHAAPNPVASRFVVLKDTIEQSAAGKVLTAVDPLPSETYETLRRIAQLSANARSMQRFVNFPGVRAAMDHPKVAALLRDPDLTAAVAEKRFFAALTNAKLVAAANDPEVAERLRAIDFEQALGHALQEGSRAKR